MAYLSCMPPAEGHPGEAGNRGKKSHRLLPGLPDGDDGGYRKGPVLSEPGPMNFPEGENVGAGFLFCPEVIARDQEAGVRPGHEGRWLA